MSWSINTPGIAERMMEEISHRVNQALERGDLFQARQLVLQALQHGGNPETVGQCLGKLACKFKQVGQVEQALELLERKCRLLGDQGDQAALKRWQREFKNIGWSMARRDPQHSSRTTLVRKEGPMRFRSQWHYTFPAGSLNPEEPLNLPAPIIAQDMLITFHDSRQGFIGLDLNSGTLQWESGVLAESLDFSSTPVYRRPRLYCAVPGFVKRLSPLDTGTPAEIVESNHHLAPAPHTAPLAWGEFLVFPGVSELLIYDLQRDRKSYYGMELKDNELLRLPVVCRDKLFLFTNLARVFTWDPKEPGITLVKDLSPKVEVTCSAPCAVDQAIYFELVTREGHRRVGCYLPEEDRHFSRELTSDPKELCGLEHRHLLFPPIAADNGVVLCSDVFSRLYKASLAGDQMEVLPLTLGNEPSSTAIDRIAQVYSSTLNSFLLSKSYGGFCVVNLLNGSAVTEVFQPQPWEMISQPIVYGNKVLFVCNEGVTCYEVL